MINKKQNITNDFGHNGFVCPTGHLPMDLVKIIDSIVISTSYNTFAQDGCKENIRMESKKNSNNPNFPLMRIATHPYILDMVQQIIGPNIILFGITKFFKEGIDKDKNVPWHQDGYYYPIKPLKAITLTIAITETKKMNGCLKVIIGSHKYNIYNHDSNNSNLDFNGKIIEGLFPSINKDQIKGKEIIDIELEPYNSKSPFVPVISIHDCQVIHSSWPNLSGDPRKVFVFRYMPSTSVYKKSTHIALNIDRDLGYDKRDLFLVRGKDLNYKINQSIPFLDLW